MHIVSIGIEIFQTPPLIFPHYILLCHVCYIRRFHFFGTIQQCVKFCEVLGLCNKSILLSTSYIVRRTISAKYSLETGSDNAYQAVHVCYMNLSRVLRLWIEHQSINIIGTMLTCCLLYCLTYNFGPHYWYWGCPLSWWFLIKKRSGDSSRRCQNFLNGWISTVK